MVNLTLAMIVRDEIMNPAGGILASIQHHAPMFDEVVVLDTGSIDGTKELLKTLRSDFPNLKSYSAPFRGYADARNRLLKRVKTDYVCMLDADERMDAEQLKKARRRLSKKNYVSLAVVEVRPSGLQYDPSLLETWNPRIFLTSQFHFFGLVGESVTPGLSEKNVASGHFYHFVPDPSGFSKKHFGWYVGLPDRISMGISPSSSEHFSKWKIPSRVALERHGINLSSVTSQLSSYGIGLPSWLS
jgi:glycosyltransferase involved in cell wall biosynthesis